MTIIQTPSGNWQHVGFGLHVSLVWRRKDGQPLTDKDLETIRYCGAPGMFGYTSVSFPTKEDAEAAVLAIT